MQITENRLSKFEAFRASLPEDEQRMLDLKMQRWQDTIIEKNDHPVGFGVKSAQELFVALIEFGDHN